MKQDLKALVWRRLDPLVAKLGARLWHLGAMRRPVDLAALGQTMILGAGIEIEPDAELFNCAARDHLSIGDYAWIRGHVGVTSARGRLAIGHHVVIGQHTRIWASLDIRIGHYVKIAHAVDIHDSDSHSMDPAIRRQEAIDFGERRQPPNLEFVGRAPVRIEDQAWICLKATILKGVTIGQGAIVAAGAVVTEDVAPFTLVAGNPARFVKRVDGDVRRAMAPDDDGPLRRAI